MNSSSQVLGFRFAALFGPVVAVGLFQVVMDEPSSARAQSVNTEFIPLPTVPAHSFDISSELNVEITSNSPFSFEETEMALPVLPQLPGVQPKQDNQADPVFILTTVLPSANRSYAVINGKPYAEGDLVGNGWTLMKISGQDRYIVLKHTSGRRIRVMMSK